MPSGGELSQRVLIFAPVGRDGDLLSKAAQDHRILTLVCRDVDEFCGLFESGCGAALLTEEALYVRRGRQLGEVVATQPSWSEVPFVMLTSRGQADERVRLTVNLMNPLRNVTVLERPVRPSTIVTALDAALRDRRRQYEVRDAIESLSVANQELERRVEERTADLVAKIVELEGFCYSVSHDMRAPLRAIVGNAAIFLEEHGDRVDAEGRCQLQGLANAALKMARLVDDLLVYARLAGAPPKVERFDLSDLAHRVADELLFDRKLSAKVIVEPNIHAVGDAKLIGLVLQNLIDNAVKYRSPDRSPVVEVGREGESYFVRDNGIGFEMQYAFQIFKPFERLHRDGDVPGTGIGLANVQRIVERHKGRLWALSEPGAGSTFYFTLGAGEDPTPNSPNWLPNRENRQAINGFSPPFGSEKH